MARYNLVTRILNLIKKRCKKMNTKTVINIIKEYLDKNKYDGLWLGTNWVNMCQCDKENLFRCLEDGTKINLIQNCLQCTPGKKIYAIDGDGQEVNYIGNQGHN